MCAEAASERACRLHCTLQLMTPYLPCWQVGGVYTRGPVDMGAHAVRAGQLITGQNPASSRMTAEALVEALSFGVRLTP